MDADRAKADETLISLAPFADLNNSETTKLIAQASEWSDVGKQPLKASVKAAIKDHQDRVADDQREETAAQTTDDVRIKLTAPPADAERTPILVQIDEVFLNDHGPNPPMRDIDGRPAHITVRHHNKLHELLSVGSNPEEAEAISIKAPQQPLITQHDECSMGLLIEQYIKWQHPSGRYVALAPPFIQHYQHYQASKLPRVSAVVTSPVMLPNGKLLVGEGLDRELGIFFKIDPKLRDILPKPDDCDAAAVEAAMRYLTEEWLCDVLTDFSGHCVLIAAALTIMQRAVLTDGRPVFFVTAGQRGGGKTTALNMVVMAATGVNASAAQWSSNVEERRKSLFAYCLEGVPALVWDNIPRGTSIACQHIERAATAPSITDRELGITGIRTAPATTVNMFTGNNVGPSGDLSSRSLKVPLNVDRLDPENRLYKHPDGIGWTVQHRGNILRALYTIMLGNPRLREAAPAQAGTRFQTWERMIGTAIENGARSLGKNVDFVKLFLETESEDDETTEITGVIGALKHTFSDKPFSAKQVWGVIPEKEDYESEEISTMRGYFSAPGLSGIRLMSSKSMGKKLAAMTGTPAKMSDGKLVKLVKNGDVHNGQKYKVVPIEVDGATTPDPIVAGGDITPDLFANGQANQHGEGYTNGTGWNGTGKDGTGTGLNGTGPGMVEYDDDGSPL